MTHDDVRPDDGPRHGRRDGRDLPGPRQPWHDQPSPARRSGGSGDWYDDRNAPPGAGYLAGPGDRGRRDDPGRYGWTPAGPAAPGRPGYGAAADRPGDGRSDDREGYGPADDRAGHGPADGRASHGPADDREGYGPADDRSGQGRSGSRAGYGPADDRAGQGPIAGRAGYGPIAGRAGYGPADGRAGYGSADDRSELGTPAGHRPGGPVPGAFIGRDASPYGTDYDGDNAAGLYGGGYGGEPGSAAEARRVLQGDPLLASGPGGPGGPGGFRGPGGGGPGGPGGPGGGGPGGPGGPGSRGPGSGPAGPGKKRRSRLRKTLKIGGLALAVLILLGIGTVGLMYARTDVPDPNALPTNQIATIYYGDGEMPGSV